MNVFILVFPEFPQITAPVHGKWNVQQHSAQNLWEVSDGCEVQQKKAGI
jgi:hypothetical protein